MRSNAQVQSNELIRFQSNYIMNARSQKKLPTIRVQARQIIIENVLRNCLFYIKRAPFNAFCLWRTDIIRTRCVLIWLKL